MKWIDKLFKFKIPEEWHHPDSFMYNVLHLIFWAIFLGVFVFLLTRVG